MNRYTFKNKGDANLLIRNPEGKWVRYRDAQTKIDRLENENDCVRCLNRELIERYRKMIQAAQESE